MARGGQQEQEKESVREVVLVVLSVTLRVAVAVSSKPDLEILRDRGGQPSPATADLRL